MKIKTTDPRKIPSENGLAAAPVEPVSKGNLAIIRNAKSEEETCPFRSLIRQWLDDCQANGLSPKTIKGYREIAFKFWWWWDQYTHHAEKEGPGPQNVTTRHIKEFALYLRTPLAFRWGERIHPGKELLSSVTVASYGRSLKVFFNWLEGEGYIDHTPVNRQVKFTTKKRDHTVKRVEDDQLGVIFTYLTDPRRLATFVGTRDLTFPNFGGV